METLATLRSEGESLAEVAHDARNMVTALGLYCDLLEEPGVLATPFTHYGNELRLVAAASRRLVEKLVALDGRRDARTGTQALRTARRAGGRSSGSTAMKCPSDAALDRVRREHGEPNARAPGGARDMLPAVPVANLAAELLANRNLLAALAGPAIAVTVDCRRRRAAGAADRRRPDPGAGEPGEECCRGHARRRTNPHRLCASGQPLAGTAPCAGA